MRVLTNELTLQSALQFVRRNADVAQIMSLADESRFIEGLTSLDLLSEMYADAGSVVGTQVMGDLWMSWCQTPGAFDTTKQSCESPLADNLATRTTMLLAEKRVFLLPQPLDYYIDSGLSR